MSKCPVVASRFLYKDLARAEGNVFLKVMSARCVKTCLLKTGTTVDRYYLKSFNHCMNYDATLIGCLQIRIKDAIKNSFLTIDPFDLSRITKCYIAPK